MTDNTGIVPVILCGGAGKRLWPLSRHNLPKQFINLNSSKFSLFQETVIRSSKIDGAEDPIIVTNADHQFLVTKQLDEVGIKAQKIILEPVGRNTSAAIITSALYIKSKFSEKVMLVLPSDHVINNPINFYLAVSEAKQLAVGGNAVTFGITPDKPETGFGYIKAGKKISSSSYSIKKFVEKPDLETAKSYINSGEYYWNSGMFAFKAEMICEEMSKYSPQIIEQCSLAHKKSKDSGNILKPDRNEFMKVPSISIDYSVMEHTQKAAMVPIDCEWSDAGSWDSIYQISAKSNGDLVRYGKGHDIDSKNSLIRAEGVPIYTIGADDLVVVSTSDAVVVAKKGRSQEVQKLVEKITLNNPKLVKEHNVTERPWGRYEIISESSGAKVKKIFVNSKASLSLQFHNHRSEIWVVVRGKAEAVRDLNGDREIKNLSTGDVFLIPKGSTHKLTNIGREILEIVEVQLGDYLEEDDIVRLEDKYGRVEQIAV